MAYRLAILTSSRGAERRKAKVSWARSAFLVLVAVITTPFFGPGEAFAATCSQFPNQAAAQAAANTVDADGDGIYCESLPCPCSTAQAGAQPQPAQPTPVPPTPTPVPVPMPAPDTDSDGVPDAQDQCPTTSGPAPSGCPPPADSDADGVPDSLDTCPALAGVAPGGCPAPAARTSANTLVLCAPKGSDDGRIARRKPAACDTLGPDDAFADGANLARLKWRNWGGATATASGIEKGYQLPYAKTSVQVTLSRPKPNDCGGYSYTQLRVKSKYGSKRQSLPAVCDETS